MAGQIEIDEDNARNGLIGAVVAIVEVIHEVLKLQALRRMRDHSLTDEELDRLGRALLAVERALEELKQDLGLTDAVAAFRSDLDGLVAQVLDPLLTTGGPA